jgi:hypothetical protein
LQLENHYEIGELFKCRAKKEKNKNPNRKSLGRILNMIVHMRIHFIHGPWVE